MLFENHNYFLLIESKIFCFKHKGTFKTEKSKNKLYDKDKFRKRNKLKLKCFAIFTK